MLAASLFCATSFAEIVQVQPGDNLLSAANALNPGDELVLADGTYEMTPRFLITLRGTEAAPIIFRAADGASPLIHRPNDAQNIWDLDAEHLVLRGLRFSGGSAGLRFLHAEHVTVEACEIFDTGGVAIRMNDGEKHYRQNTIIGNHIYGTAGHGEGMYLGCNSNGCQFSESLIANNYIHHTNGPNVSQGDGIEIKEGSWGNTIRDNVIHDTGYPCIITYSTAGNGPANIIEGNAMWACGDNAIQSSQDATIRNNIILGAAGSGIAMQPHQSGAPTNLEVVHNTVITSGDAIALRGATGNVLIANNAVYSTSGSALRLMGDLGAVEVDGNVGTGGINGPDGGLTVGDIAADFVDANAGGGVMDVYPAAGGALIGAGNAGHVADHDFNGTPRQGVADVGAYRFDEAGNPGWALTPGFKDISESPVDPGDPDMGTGADAGTEPLDPDMGTGANGNNGTNGGSDAGVTPNAEGNVDSGSDGCGCSTGAAPSFPGALFLACIGFMVAVRRKLR